MCKWICVGILVYYMCFGAFPDTLSHFDAPEVEMAISRYDNAQQGIQLSGINVQIMYC